MRHVEITLLVLIRATYSKLVVPVAAVAVNHTHLVSLNSEHRSRRHRSSSHPTAN